MFWWSKSSNVVVVDPDGEEPEACYSPPTKSNKLEPLNFGSAFSKAIIECVQPTSQDSGCWLIFICQSSRAIHFEYCSSQDQLTMLDCITKRFFELYEVPEEILFYPKHSFQQEPDSCRIRLGQLLRQLEGVHNFKLNWNPNDKPLWNRFYPMTVQTLSFALRSFDTALAHFPVDSCKQKLAELVNSRPLLKRGNEWGVLTPEHLVTGNQFAQFPKVDLGGCNELTKFWKRWSLNYLNWLKEYHLMNAYIPSSGELVLLWNSHQISGSDKVGFMLAVIEEIERLEGSILDSKALVRLQSGESLTQDMRNLVPLECSQNDELLTSVLIPLHDYLGDDVEDDEIGFIR